MLKNLTAFVFVLFFGVSFGQELSWNKLYEIPLDSGALWSVDISKQVYVFQQQTITKFTAQGKKSMVQSIKSLGNISSIDANNQLKIAVFSEEQQSICFFDNALANSTECLNLSDFNIEWADLFATSNQTDRFWIFDQVNNELRLLTTGTQQKQIIQNLKQVSDIATPVSLFERNNYLFIIDEKKQLSVFDVFGTFLNTYPMSDYSDFFVSESNVFGVKNNHIYMLFNFDENTFVGEKIISVPLELMGQFTNIRCSGDYVFFSTNSQLSAYQILQTPK